MPTPRQRYIPKDYTTDTPAMRRGQTRKPKDMLRVFNVQFMLNKREWEFLEPFLGNEPESSFCRRTLLEALGYYRGGQDAGDDQDDQDEAAS